MTDLDHYIRAATRDNTRLSYRAAVEHFESHWGGFLPATADSVARYLVDYANTLSVNTLRQRLAGLAAWHLDQGFPDPTKAPHVKKVLKGIAELHPVVPKQAKPIQLDQLTLLVSSFDHFIETGSPKEALQSIRDKALLLIGFWRAFRSDELARLSVEHIGVLGILPPNTAKTSEAPVFASLQRGINFYLSADSPQSAPLNHPV